MLQLLQLKTDELCIRSNVQSRKHRNVLSSGLGWSVSILNSIVHVNTVIKQDVHKSHSSLSSNVCLMNHTTTLSNNYAYAMVALLSV